MTASVNLTLSAVDFPSVLSTLPAADTSAPDLFAVDVVLAPSSFALSNETAFSASPSLATSKDKSPRSSSPLSEKPLSPEKPENVPPSFEEDPNTPPA